MSNQKKDVPWVPIIQAVVSLVTALINRPRKGKEPQQPLPDSTPPAAL